MDKLVLRDNDFRRLVFNDVAVKKRIPPVIVEKDFWVCWILGKLFQSPDISSNILFKGGTSLSKVFNIIERFSEDIDLVIDWRLFADEDPWKSRSRSKQELFNQKISRATAEYLKGTLLLLLRDIIPPACSADIDDRDPHVINLSYPASYKDRYIYPVIRLETGTLASWVPHGEYSIRPYAADVFPDIFEKPECRVKAIKAERTFWEKVTILHQEANRPEGKHSLPRYSRHYYDLSRMANSPIRNRSLREMKLLEDVVTFKQKFYPRAWACYELATPGTLKLMPPEHLIKDLEKDYALMRNMIFGEYPVFQSLLESLKDLQEEINQLGLTE